MPLSVSILIPCYNAETWIGAAVESALAQTYPHCEVIVVDDGSSDGSVEVLRGFGNAIRLETGPNRGGNATRNRLLELSEGEWLQYLDSDDYLLPDKIAAQVAHLEAHPDIDILCSPATGERYEGDSTSRRFRPFPEPHDPWILLARWYLPQTGGPLWRKTAIARAGKWDVEQPCCQEHELYSRLLVSGARFGYLNQPGAIYRLWSTGTVSRKNKWEVYRRRLQIEDRIEAHLAKTGELTPERQAAIDQARFECARTIWSSDRDWAKSLIEQIRQHAPDFVPMGDAAPAFYRAVFQMLGFTAAEQVAQWKRSLVRS
ncbi:MAG: glycosyltransferase [Cyanobacteria bacterium P01_D01_bin.123]